MNVDSTPGARAPSDQINLLQAAITHNTISIYYYYSQQRLIIIYILVSCTILGGRYVHRAEEKYYTFVL